MVRDMKRDPILPLNGLFLQIGEEGADGTSLSMWSGRQFMCHKWEQFVVFYYSAGGGEELLIWGPVSDSWDCYF